MVDWLKGKGFGGSNGIDQLTKTINEQSDNQRKIIAQFNKAMNEFATERSLETCLDALNLSMQLANIRGKLAESYEYYARLSTRNNNAEQNKTTTTTIAGYNDREGQFLIKQTIKPTVHLDTAIMRVSQGSLNLRATTLSASIFIVMHMTVLYYQQV